MRCALAVATAAACALIVVATAFAHSEPAVVRPGQGAVLNAPPSQIEIQMTQEMARQSGANDIDVMDATGKEVTTVSAVVDNGDRRKLSVAMPSTLAVGVYTVKWKTLSLEDGDAANGEYAFTYDPSKPADPGKEQLKDAAPAGGSPTASAPPASVAGGGDDGMTWVLAVAMGAAGLAIGSGATFLLVRKKT